ncbi:MAG TPA: phage tail protein [Ruminiclostridium sp.]|nr:phage tail protein [Ruminiclostridium sp.]
MYDKFKYFSVNPLGGFHRGFLQNLLQRPDGLVYTVENKQEALYYSLSFDSQENGNTWHKVRIWAQVPDGMYYEISCHASDYKEYGENGEDLDTYMLDPSVSNGQKASHLKALWNTWKEGKRPIVNAEDALLMQAQGRYLWFMLRINYNFLKEENKPLIIQKIRLYYPRMSFLDYLPSVYQENSESRDFLERFLSIFSTIHDEMEETIDNLARYFDADTVEGEYLKWLSRWLSIASDDRWDESSLRELVKTAPEIYRIRGMKRAIEKMIAVYTGEKPIIIEYFQYKEHLKDPGQSEHILKLYGDDPYTFTVLVRAGCVRENHQKIAVRKILQEEKPAYTEARLVVLQNSIELDGYTYLGINSVFAGAAPLLLDPEKSVLYNNELIRGQELEA